ncbi:putative DDRGK domain-containing protein 1 [Blattamonas nauphoetae]|uniref:DDRGK domain-containing protein 1 n=1 Tax=Blattamonas nauphoetae TaxID=2049346 RepID=A0ABQ9XJF6_9EUKA|nr:putative DDRGK domain-containing protein 1 [Blattamonas nauphoetae]
MGFFDAIIAFITCRKRNTTKDSDDDESDSDRRSVDSSSQSEQPEQKKPKKQRKKKTRHQIEQETQIAEMIMEGRNEGARRGPGGRRGARVQRPHVHDEQDHSDSDEHIEEPVQRPNQGQRIGAKKIKKMEQKQQKQQDAAERRAMIEEQKRLRQEQIEAEDEERRRIQEEEKRKEEERQRRIREEREREQREYEKSKQFITLIEEDFDAPDSSGAGMSSGIVTQFVDFIKRKRMVSMESVATEFGLTTPEALNRIQSLQEMGTLPGVLDDRGRFFYISVDELKDIAKEVKRRGRVSIADLTVFINPEQYHRTLQSSTCKVVGLLHDFDQVNSCVILHHCHDPKQYPINKNLTIYHLADAFGPHIPKILKELSAQLWTKYPVSVTGYLSKTQVNKPPAFSHQIYDSFVLTVSFFVLDKSNEQVIVHIMNGSEHLINLLGIQPRRPKMVEIQTLHLTELENRRHVQLVQVLNVHQELKQKKKRIPPIKPRNEDCFQVNMRYNSAPHSAPNEFFRASTSLFPERNAIPSSPFKTEFHHHRDIRPPQPKQLTTPLPSYLQGSISTSSPLISHQNHPYTSPPISSQNTTQETLPDLTDLTVGYESPQ